MDVILLSGGFGTRLEPISLFIPKALLPIGGKPLLDKIIDELTQYKEVERIIVDTNDKFVDQFRHYIATKKAAGLKNELELVVEPTKHNGEKLGQTKGIEYALKHGKINSDFLIISTDNYFDFKLKEMIEHFEKSKKPTIGIYDTDSLDLLTRSGVVELDGDRIIEFEEKPAKPKTSLLCMGLYIFPKSSIKTIEDYLKETGNNDSMGFFVKWLIRKEEVHAVKCKGVWVDIGTLDAYKRVFEMTSNK